MDELYTYMDETVGRVDKTNDVESGKEFTWDTDKVDAFKLDATDLAAVDAGWLTIVDGADLRFRRNSDKNLVQLNGAVSFTMEKAGTVTVELASTGSSNYSSFALSTTASEGISYIEVSEISGSYTDGDETKNTYVEGGEDVTVDSKSLALGQYATYTSANHTTAVWEVKAGEYTFETALAGTWSRAARIYAISITYPGAGWAEASVTEFELSAEDIAALATDGTSKTVTAQQEGELQDTEGNNVYKIDTEYTATLIVSIPAGSEGVTFSFKTEEEEEEESTTDLVEGTEIAGADILAAINAVDDVTISALTDLTSLTLGGAYAYSIVTEEKVTYTYYTTTETIDGYLTVTLAGETVGDANQDAEVTITTHEVTGEVTMAIAEIVVSSITLSNVAITFTPDADGAFENGAVSGNVAIISISATAAGSYVIDENGDITFTADFEYMNMAIGVSFTTTLPTTEGTESETSVEWKLASQSWGAEWGGTTWTGVSSAAGVLELTTTVGDIMTADGVEELGGINFQIWNVNGYEGTEISWTFTVTTADDVTVVTDAGQGVIGTDYEVNQYGAITLGQYNTSICYGSYTFATTDVVNATVTIVGDIVYTAISDLTSDVEAVEVARYNLMGQKISTAEKGINIIVYSDGSAKKVLVK